MNSKINIVNYYDAYVKPMVICLGFFDCVHRGHNSLIQKARLFAKINCADCFVFTFINNPFEQLNKPIKEIFTFEERVYRLYQLGIDNVLAVKADKDFFALSAQSFLDILFRNFNVVGVVAGNDYTFGKNAQGSVLMLEEYCKKRNIDCHIVDMVQNDVGKKIASRDIRELVKEGNVSKINSLLPLPYIIKGDVVSGRHQGSAMGYPTANIQVDDQKMLLAEGVYDCNVCVDGKKYKALTNVGNHPTFDDYNYNIECHILGFESNLYGKNIVVEFMDKIREVKKFNSKEELALQIKQDIQQVKTRIIL